MTDRYHDIKRGHKALSYGSANAIGPLSNPRHPRKVKKKTAPGGNTEGGEEGQA